MSRDEKIEILIEDRFWDWIYARNYEGLEIMLYEGFIGFDDYSDKEIDEAIADLGEDKVEEIKKMLKDKVREK